MNELRDFFSNLPAPFKNKYFLVLGIFLAYMFFVDRHDFWTQWRLQRTVNKLENDKVYYDKQIEEAEQERLDMKVNEESFARERYFMQKNDDDVFIIKKEEKQ